jgi:tyrosyl-tRNA synthetase
MSAEPSSEAVRSFPAIEHQLAVIRRGAVDLIPEEELIDKLKRSIEKGRPLRIKLGCDPTRPDLHVGHSVILRKLRQFQDLGHEAILIIGDFTALIGDPTGQNKTRPALSKEEIQQNAETYLEQVGRILDPEKTRIVYNSHWLSRLTFMDLIQISGRVTVARMIEREDFSKRYQANESISLHEFLYPLAQGMDSVELRSDVELGGTDQLFNLLIGRDLQRAEGQEPQVCLTMPLLVGTDGSRKMSKSYDNYIGITESPEQMYGKVLSIPDERIFEWYELLTDLPETSFESVRKAIRSHPRDAKHDLALRITAGFHGQEEAERAREHFEKTVIHKEIPDDAPVLLIAEGSPRRLMDILSELRLTGSNGESRRLIQQGGVSLNEEKVQDHNAEVVCASGQEIRLRVGKRRYAILKGTP